MEPDERIAVGVIVARSKGSTPWTDYVWRPVDILLGAPDTAPWTKLSDDGERATFYVGASEIELYRSDTTGYRENLISGAPSLWIALRPTQVDPPYELFKVTADSTEGESLTEAGDDIVEALPMPAPVQAALAAFVEAHHVERVFVKRKRDRADPNALSRRAPVARKDGE